ncbi:hypothetical protein Rsub_12301 [Raphidocelis subcapitata]|uniref:RRP15-like protein n=1 Tax=Raphidocelis subcapitata TaxID=307507 RepID=A0A2V0PKR8_9CHLO|nr:hypothetical protein Rsub_12301 [Raphidocelis subcapitata]|eukprot:GBF99622.1 hypothetical protein Rsub_12301 [Raphidocelis subcapitata]
MGKKRVPQQPEPPSEEMESEEEAGSSGGGSDEGNDYGMGSGSGSDGEGAGGSGSGDGGDGEGPGILGLASDSDDDGGGSGGAEGEDGEEQEEEEGEEEEAEEEEEEQREPGSSDADDEGGSDSGSGGDGDGDGGPRRAGHASFLAGEKGASFAKAFAKIISKPVKGPKAAKAAAAGGGDLILAESAGVQKRKVEEEEDAAARHEAKKQRLAMRTRGHLTVPRKGEDPAHDVREKQLQRLATRGVVLLFNAVNKAQRQKAEAEAAGGVAKRKAAVAKLGKASFLAELKQAATKGVPVDAAAAEAPAGKGQQQREPQRGAAAGAAWDVFGEGFPGLTRGAKMKDWDARAGSDDDEVGEQPRLADAEISSDEGGGW